MGTVKSTFKTNKNTLILLLLELAVGILLLVDAQSFANLIFIVIGAFFIIKAVQGTVEYFRTPAEVAVLGQGFAAALVCLAVGAFLVFQSQWLVSLFPALAAVFGVALVLTGFSKIQWAVDLLRVHNAKWYFPAIAAGVAIVCGAVVCSGAFSNEGLLVFSAVAMLAGALLDIVSIVMAVKGRAAVEAGAETAAAVATSAAETTVLPAESAQEASTDAEIDYDVFDAYEPIDDQAEAAGEVEPTRAFDAVDTPAVPLAASDVAPTAVYEPVPAQTTDDGMGPITLNGKPIDAN